MGLCPTIRAEDYLLAPHHISEATLSRGHTHFVIQLPNMTWTAKLVYGGDGNLYFAIRDEFDVPLEDSKQILSWMLMQPLFVRRIWELAHHPAADRSI